MSSKPSKYHDQWPRPVRFICAHCGAVGNLQPRTVTPPYDHEYLRRKYPLRKDREPVVYCTCGGKSRKERRAS